MAARLSFDGIGKRYGERIALDALSLAVQPGEIFGFLGPNGAGKSTAIYLAMGFLRASSGRGQLLGLPFDRARAARARVGYVPDAPVFFAGSALDAILLAARLNDAERTQTADGLRRYAMELLRRFDLSTDSTDKGDARKFSRGQQQRVAIAQALITRPELLILDEPTSALDPPSVVLVREALRNARSEGASVFFSSHQLQEVELLCDRAAFLDQGRLLHLGPMAELLEEGATARITLRRLSRESEFARANAPALLADRPKIADGTANADTYPANDALLAPLIFSIPVEDQRRFLEQAWNAGAELVGVEREHRTLADLFEQRRQNARPDAKAKPDGKTGPQSARKEES